MKEIEVNEHGRLVFRNKTNNDLFAHKPYRWVDRIIVIDEASNRKLVLDTKYSTFDLTDWEPISKEDYDKVVCNFTELNKKLF